MEDKSSKGLKASELSKISGARSVAITMKTIQYAEGEKDVTELFSRGELVRKSGKFVLSYQDSEVTGFNGDTIITVADDDVIDVMRSGEYFSHLTLEHGQKHHYRYESEHGEFMLGVTADELNSSFLDGENGCLGSVYARYTLDINSALVSQNEMYIDFNEIQ